MSDSTDPTKVSPAKTSAQSNTARPHPGRKLLWTLVPIAFYLIAYQLDIPTFHKATFDVSAYVFPECHALMAVGLFPWFFAAVVVQIVVMVVSSDRQSTISHTDLYRTMNFVGFVFAILHCAWVVFSWTEIAPLAVGLLGISLFLPSSSGLSSPILAFSSLLGCTIFFRIFVLLALPRSLLAKNRRLVAITFLAPVLCSVASHSFSFRFMNNVDTVRMVGRYFQCIILIAFILLNPQFFSRHSQIEAT